MRVRLERLHGGHDLQAVADVNQRAFPPHLKPWLSQCQPGFGQFLTATEPDKRTTYWVALDGERVAGFAEWRMIGETAFLNYIGIAPSAQGRGIGRQMLAAHLAEVECQSVGLDVFTDEPAFDFYTRLGFEVFEHRTWHRRSIPGLPADVADLRVEDVQGWRHQMDTFGFGHLRCAIGVRDISLHFSSANAVRLPEVADVWDDSLLAAIRNIAPSTRSCAAIEVSEEPTYGHRDGESLLHAARLRAALPEIRV